MGFSHTGSLPFDELAMALYKHDPNSGSASIVTPDGGTTKRLVDLRNYGTFAVMVMFYTGTAVTKVEIVACTDTAGSNATVIATSGTVAADAVGDYVCLSCNAMEVRAAADAAGLDLRYVGARITSSSADEAAVWYARGEARFVTTGQTATSIA